GAGLAGGRRVQAPPAEARGAGRLSEREACTACEEQARSRGRAGDASATGESGSCGTPRGRMASARPKGPRRAAAGAPGARPARPAGAACVEALGHARPGPPGGGCRGGGGTCPT
ncbi:unnamed protein product, partial [Prorocentrum cordatum]